jgi:rubrerythrin
MDLKDSKTKENLLRSFAGESQARNRYDIGASVAKKEGLFIIENLFKYTADQERVHAKQFYENLKSFNGDNIDISGGYPVSYYDQTTKNLQAAENAEYEEWETVYADFAKVAKEEGFIAIAGLFERIASIEKVHGDRFKKYKERIENNMLFKSEEESQWMCTVCGYIHEGKEAPKACPVCAHPQGYFILFRESLFEEFK